ncbi:hypothetical protein J2X36_005457 [Methylobacterium sp. BE186]|uniref:hypothetical protein n=1 Tax=Methylobacterium sp. BE186 TaxID=2817715 RepID=UPI00285C15F5|nr:hypothetical protein [Methylobacterium sp. BE186]MDR7040670.1 hypothetical protein [Methylobacterium sp. BE186]
MSTRQSDKNALLSLLMLGWPIFLIGPADAHRPYFTRSEMVTLPDGRPGEMRIIAGDGLMAADPTRLLVLDEHGRLLARSAGLQLVDLVCDASRHCYGYNRVTGEIVEPDPTTFGANGTEVPPMGERDGLELFEGGSDTWGVVNRPTTFKEWVFCEWHLLWRTNPIIPGYFLVLGLLAGSCFLGLGKPHRQTFTEIADWCLEAGGRLFGCSVVVLFAVPLLLVVGPPWTIWLGTMFVGSLIPIGLARLRKRSPSHARAFSTIPESAWRGER